MRTPLLAGLFGLSLIASLGATIPFEISSTPPAEATPRPPFRAPQAAQQAGAILWATNPTTGARLWLQAIHPQGWTGAPLPTLVMVPGGNGDSSIFTNRGQAQTVANAGFTVVVFDPDGRGRSGGLEDYGGFIHQDGLKAVIEAARSAPGVDPNRIALVTNSYGVTMATGVLARYPDLPIRFLIDWEGPVDRTDTGGCGGGNGHLTSVARCDDESFWSQREAITFIRSVRVPYLRMQSQRDHVQPDVTHAVKIVNAAVEGEAPWVRLNDDPPNQTYSVASPPAMLPDALDRDRETLIARYATELFALTCPDSCTARYLPIVER